MSIPGYVFDHATNRYFRITNGDASFNPQFSNGAVRARARLDEKAKRPRIESQNAIASQTSLDAAKGMVPLDVRSQFLSMKLGGRRPDPVDCFVTMFRSYDTLTDVYESSLWPGLNDETVFQVADHTISLSKFEVVEGKMVLHCLGSYNAEEFGFGFLPDELELDTVGLMRELKSDGEWVWARKCMAVSLTRWQCLGGRYAVTNHTAHFLLAVKEQLPTKIKKKLSVTPFNLGIELRDLKVHVLVPFGYMIVLSFPHFELESIQEWTLVRGQDDFRPPHLEDFYPDSAYQSQLTNRNWLMHQDNNYYEFTKVKRKIKAKMTKLYDHVYRVFRDDGGAGAHMSQINSTYRMIVVTTRSVRVYQKFSGNSLQDKKVVHKLEINIDNGNYVQPLIEKIGEYLFVQELERDYKIINLATMHVSSAKFPPDILSGARLLRIGGLCFLSNQTRTQLLSHGVIDYLAV